MDLNRVDWSNAQDLLLKLVQILSPFTEKGTPASLFLNQRFFIPPLMGGQVSTLRSSVRLLSSLRTVQKQMGELLEKNEPSPEAGENLQGPVSEKKEPAKTSAEEKKSPPAKNDLPLYKQAQKLIDQVQDAIGNLCQSSHIKDPKEEPLREALKRLKPNLDRMIDGVTHEGMHDADEGLPSSRYILPRSPREHLLKKLIPFPEKETSNQASNPQTRSHEFKKTAVADLPKEKKEEKLAPLPTAEPLQQKQETPSHSDTPSINKTAVAPYVSVTKQFSAPKKKKRKGFWFRKEEEEEERNNS